MRRLGRIIALGGAAGATLVALLAFLGVYALPAGAHHAILSGSASCPGADHVIDWSIGNSQPKEAMTITEAKAMLGTMSYAVTGYASPLPPAGTTSAQTTIPGPLAGAVTLWVHGLWTDGHTSGRHVTVDLSTPCGASTTVPASSTSVPVSISEPPTLPPSSVPVATVPTAATDGGSLAFTGAGIDLAILVALLLVATGLALWRPWVSSR